MATVTTTERTPANSTTTASETMAMARGDQLVRMRGINWQGYSDILEIKGDRRLPRVLFLDGEISFMSPSPKHEFLNDRLRSFLRAILTGLGIPFLSFGSTTFRLEKAKAGVEGDQSYYLANRKRVRDEDAIDLRVDPPPDLAIEVVVTHSATDALEVYGRFGVPEVWVCTEKELHFLSLDADGRYARIETSSALPGIPAAEIHTFISRRGYEDEGVWEEELRRWIAEVVVPRRRGDAT